MLWLAGLMGLFAVGSVSVVEMESIFGAGPDESNADLDVDKNEQDAAEPTGASSDLADIETQTSTPNTEPDGVEIQVTDGDEFQFGTDNADTMTGGAGNDTLHGRGDDDLIQGDAGNDTLFGHNGDDTLHGGTGADRCKGLTAMMPPKVALATMPFMAVWATTPCLAAQALTRCLADTAMMWSADSPTVRTSILKTTAIF